MSEKIKNLATETTRLDPSRVTFVYTMFHHLGDFVVMAGLLRKFDLTSVGFESIVAHRGSPHISLFTGNTSDRFFNISSFGGLFHLVRKLRQQKREGRIIFGLPMAPGSIQAHLFIRLLKSLGALTYVVDFNLVNADILTPPRRGYIFDRHLAQAGELLQRPDWLNDTRMPLGLKFAPANKERSRRQVGLFPESARSWMPEFKWPQERWLELTRRILDRPEYDIALIGRGPIFSELEQHLKSQLSPLQMERVKMMFCANVEQLMEALHGCERLMTVNTSALHLAHAMQIPLVALVGSSLECWWPEGEHVRLVRDTTGALPPSDQHQHDPLQASLQRVAVEDVYRAFLDLPPRL